MPENYITPQPIIAPPTTNHHAWLWRLAAFAVLGLAIATSLLLVWLYLNRETPAPSGDSNVLGESQLAQYKRDYQVAALVNGEVHIANSDGTRETKLTETGGTVTSFQFSPDYATLFFSSDSVEISGEKRTELEEMGIATDTFGNLGLNLYAYDLNSGQQQLLDSFVSFSFTSAQLQRLRERDVRAWEEQGAHIMAVNQFGNEILYARQGVWIFDISSGGSTLLTDDEYQGCALKPTHTLWGIYNIILTYSCADGSQVQRIFHGSGSNFASAESEGADLMVDANNQGLRVLALVGKSLLLSDVRTDATGLGTAVNISFHDAASLERINRWDLTNLVSPQYLCVSGATVYHLAATADSAELRHFDSAGALESVADLTADVGTSELSALQGNAKFILIGNADGYFLYDIESEAVTRLAGFSSAAREISDVKLFGLDSRVLGDAAQQVS